MTGIDWTAPSSCARGLAANCWCPACSPERSWDQQRQVMAVLDLREDYLVFSLQSEAGVQEFCLERVSAIEAWLRSALGLAQEDLLAVIDLIAVSDGSLDIETACRAIQLARGG